MKPTTLTLMIYSMQLFSELQNTIKFSLTFKTHTRYMCFGTMAKPEVAAQNGRPQVRSGSNTLRAIRVTSC